MPSIFDTVAVNKIKKSLFNLSHMRKFSGSLGNLIPIQCQEVLPGETFHFKHEAMVRFSPLLAPIMQEVDMYIEDFFVPNRIIWDNWNNFITPSDNGTYPAMPYTNLNTTQSPANIANIGGLLDYLGYPTVDCLPSGNTKVSTLPIRAYNLIWNEFYRDQNLQTALPVNNSVDGADVGLTAALQKRCWPKDYFTSALPTTQRGGDVHLPMSGNAGIVQTGSDGLPKGAVYGSVGSGSTPRADTITTDAPAGTNGLLMADLSNVNAATINELRRAEALQEYLELNMRVGGRINEYIYGNFGQRVPDYRLDRPQFLGGFRSPVVISEVDQTSATSTNSTPIGYMAGKASGLGSSRHLKFHSVEHGWIISLFSVLPKASYQQGLPRKFTRFDPLDFANPKFGNLGEQAIANREIYAKASAPTAVFGYTPRYSEYKYEPSTVHGEFKSTLNYWHMGRIFASEPALNASFVTADPATRPFAVETGNDYIRCEVYNKVKALRPLPYYGTPKLV